MEANWNDIAVTASFPAAIVDDENPQTVTAVEFKIHTAYYDALQGLLQAGSQSELIDRLTRVITVYLQMRHDFDGIREGRLPDSVDFPLSFFIGARVGAEAIMSYGAEPEGRERPGK